MARSCRHCRTWLSSRTVGAVRFFDSTMRTDRPSGNGMGSRPNADTHIQAGGN